MSNERLNRHQRYIVERIIIRGTLVLDTPTCLGNGDAEGPTDLMLLRDSISSKALLTGASIAGALRNYMYEYQYGYSVDVTLEELIFRSRLVSVPFFLSLWLFIVLYRSSLVTILFGAERKDENGNQSPLIIHDSISSEVPRVELRDGVRIKSETGTADDSAKYDLELLANGTEFPLGFELLIERKKNHTEDQFIQYKNRLIESLTIALQGLENHEISIGMKKRRGFGRCHVLGWQVWQFNLQDYQDRFAWLLLDRECIPNLQQGKIADIFKINKEDLEKLDKRCRFLIKATFKLAGSLLIRSGQFSTEAVPDVVHLKSYRENSQLPDKQESVLPGTSLAGVLRHRAKRIVNTLGSNKIMIDDLFGIVDEDSKDDNAKSSRLVVHESVIHKVNELVQNRIAIDRFTGGAYHGALFDEQPIFGKDDTQVTLNLELRQPSNAEIGLLLLLLKDLWTSDLPIGGESSIGRGRLQGIHTEMTKHTPGKEKQVWSITRINEEQLQVSDAQTLASFVDDFVREVRV